MFQPILFVQWTTNLLLFSSLKWTRLVGHEITCPPGMHRALPAPQCLSHISWHIFCLCVSWDVSISAEHLSVYLTLYSKWKMISREIFPFHSSKNFWWYIISDHSASILTWNEPYLTEEVGTVLPERKRTNYLFKSSFHNVKHYQ